MHSTWDEKNARRWNALVNDHHVSDVLAGHFHRDELHWTGDVPIYVAEPLAGYYNRQGAFRIYTWEDGHLSYNTVYLDEK
jgi:UDP-2,3-diacylglucosamine pyrophosphatase LpxH